MKSIVKFLGFIIVILALIFIPLIVYYISQIQQKEFVEKQVLALSTIATPPPEANSPKSNQLEQIFNKDFALDAKNYSVVIKNLKTGEEFRFNENKKYYSASLYKLWVMGVAFQKIKDSEFDENQTLTGDLKKLDDILSTTDPTPSPQSPNDSSKTEEVKKISMTTKDAIEKMITYSDNYAALMISSRAGMASVTNFLNKYGLVNSSFGSPPQTTANDIELYFEKLYNGGIVNKDYSEKMLDILKMQTINDRIPKYLPQDIQVAHKTGELYGVKHDAGIVFTNKGDYIMVVMSDTSDPGSAAEKIANFSKDIYSYFQQ